VYIEGTMRYKSHTALLLFHVGGRFARHNYSHADARDACIR
jgi:hypothetical protein